MAQNWPDGNASRDNFEHGNFKYMNMLQGGAILDEAERQWRVLAERRPALAPAIVVQRRLVQRALALATEADTLLSAPIHRTAAEVERGQLAGQPMLIGENVKVNGTRITPFVLGFCADLAAGSEGDPAGRLRQVLERGDIDCDSLVSASLTRRGRAIRTKAQHVGVSPDLLWLVAELAAGPIAHHVQRTIWPAAHGMAATPAAHNTAPHWSHGYCPVCGSWPAFAERDQDPQVARVLRCSFCGHGWSFPDERCVYCPANGASVITAGADPDDTGRLVAMCRECGGYLKSLAARTPIPFALLPVTDLATSDLDASAAGRGYGRPPLREFPADDLPC